MMNLAGKSVTLFTSYQTGQKFNLRKKRKGALWEDRYHATAVETGKHLVQCLVYIDFNMVRGQRCAASIRVGVAGI
jgi:hypothetical protein